MQLTLDATGSSKYASKDSSNVEVLVENACDLSYTNSPLKEEHGDQDPCVYCT